MRSWLTMLVALLGVALGRAQERTATLQLDDGRVVQGRVVAMDLESMAVEVDGTTTRIPSVRIVSCRIQTAGAAAPAEAAPPAGEPGNEAGAKPGASPKVVEPAKAVPRWTTVEEPPEAALAASFDPDAVPHDLRNRSRWRERIDEFDSRYPWLCPAAPLQWGSLGCLVFALLTLSVHISVKVTGCDQPGLLRSLFMASWYLLTTVIQVATVPSLPLAHLVVLIVNPAVALFLLRVVFGSTRVATALSFALQLGFVLLGFGILELADSLLKSVSAHPTLP